MSYQGERAEMSYVDALKELEREAAEFTPIYNVYMIWDGVVQDEIPCDDYDAAAAEFDKMQADWQHDVAIGYRPKQESDGVYFYDAWEGRLVAVCR